MKVCEIQFVILKELLRYATATVSPQCGTRHSTSIRSGLFSSTGRIFIQTPYVSNCARVLLPDIAGVAQALNTLEQLLSALDDVSIGVDLADVGTYGYHSGVTFSVYAEGWHDSIVQGGRYDDVSRAFGRARPATGFSLDLEAIWA